VLTDDQRQLVHTLMQATLHKFSLERIERDGWQGALYEVSRLDVLATHGFVTLPPHLQDVVAYVDHGDLLAEYQPTTGAAAERVAGGGGVRAASARVSAGKGSVSMCGRYTLYHDEEDLTELFELDAFPWTPRYNIAPRRWCRSCEPTGGGRERLDARWGLIPAWVKDPGAFKALLFNARSETVGEKPAFRDAARRARCVAPASGFYEWRPDPTGRQAAPTTCTAATGRRWLWPACTPSATRANRAAASTVLTTAPNAFMAELHDRMPVILEPGRLRVGSTPRPATWRPRRPAGSVPGGCARGLPRRPRRRERPVDEPRLIQPV
jgi:putative SOS response-associated peptidase YedK